MRCKSNSGMVNGFNDHNNSSFGNMIFQQLNEENLVITPQDFPFRILNSV